MNISCGKLFLGQPVSFNNSMCVLGSIHSHLWEINQMIPYIKYIFPFHFNSSLKQSKLNSNNDSSDGNHRNNRTKNFLHPQLLIDLLLSFWFRFRGGGGSGGRPNTCRISSQSSRVKKYCSLSTKSMACPGLECHINVRMRQNKPRRFWVTVPYSVDESSRSRVVLLVDIKPGLAQQVLICWHVDNIRWAFKVGIEKYCVFQTKN